MWRRLMKNRCEWTRQRSKKRLVFIVWHLSSWGGLSRGVKVNLSWLSSTWSDKSLLADMPRDGKLLCFHSYVTLQTKPNRSVCESTQWGLVCLSNRHLPDPSLWHQERQCVLSSSVTLKHKWVYGPVLNTSIKIQANATITVFFTVYFTSCLTLSTVLLHSHKISCMIKA